MHRHSHSKRFLTGRVAGVEKAIVKEKRSLVVARREVCYSLFLFDVRPPALDRRIEIAQIIFIPFQDPSKP